MSTVTKRPQLNFDELQQLRWLLGGLLALIGAWSALYLDVDAWVFLLLVSIFVPLTMARPSLVTRLPSFYHRLAFPVIATIFAFDLYTTGEPLPAMVRLDILLLLYRATSFRKRRDDLQLIVLGLFLVVVGGVLSVSPLFVIQILIFTSCALALLLVLTLTDPGRASSGKALDTRPPIAVPAASRPAAPTWTSVNWREFLRRLGHTMDWRIFVFGGGLFGLVVVSTGFLFLAIPRFQLENSLFLDKLVNRRSNSGFTDSIRFGDVSDIQEDHGVAMRVEPPAGRKLPEELYWRMVVLDEYRDQTFRMSAHLRSWAFGDEHTSVRVYGSEPSTTPNNSWTFFVEAGAGRYLPLAGSFRRIAFNEAQSFRFSDRLKLLVLSHEPMSMKPYRVDGMNTGSQIADPWFAQDFQAWRTSSADKRHGPDWLAVELSESDKALLKGAVQEIVAGRRMSAREFADAACAWLAKRHAYALRMELPGGAGDPLVRWLLSNQPGHCELFAGSLTMLARTAGFPARLVAGYMGGDWNEDYLIVRNSDAHAWCEIFDGRQHWFRIDPTAIGSRVAGSIEAGAASPNVRPARASWSARLDRLQLLWYRRIVNFEQRDQQAIVRSLRKSADDSGDWLRGLVRGVVKRAKAWWYRPWGHEQLLDIVLGVVFATVVTLTGFYFFRSWRWRLSLARKDYDPIRREAGRWLNRLKSCELPPDGQEVLREVERLRFGPRDSAPDPLATFRRARAELKRARRRARARAISQLKSQISERR